MELNRKYAIEGDDGKNNELSVFLHIGMKQYDVRIDGKTEKKGKIEDDKNLELKVGGRDITIKLIFHGFPEIQVFAGDERIIPGSVQSLQELIEKRKKEEDIGFVEKYKLQLGVGLVVIIILAIINLI